MKRIVMPCVAALALLISTLPLTTTVNAQTLYERLGGEPAIECWIDNGLEIITADARINDFFAGDLNADQALSLRDSLISFACAATGGPCVYAGRDMSCSHAGLGIDHHSFTAFMEDLNKAAVVCRRGNTQWMTDPAYSELAKVLLSLRPPIVQDDPGENPAGTPSCPN